MFTGRGVPLRRGGVDTDQVIPAEYCRRLTKTGYADGLFARWRAQPGFVLSQPERRGATILVAGPNFGTGSSREHAVWALKDWGFRAVIAASFGDIFRRNALRNGLLAIALPATAVDELLDTIEADSRFEITVDLEQRQVRAWPRSWNFEIDERVRRLLLDGRDEIDSTLEQVAGIAAYETVRQPWLPSIRPAAS